MRPEMLDVQPYGAEQEIKELRSALQEARDVLYLVSDGNVEARKRMVSNAIAVADAALK